MRFIVVRLKYVLFFSLAAVLIAVVLLTNGHAVMTFLAGGRELPIYSVKRDDNKIALTFDCAWGAEDIDDIAATLNKYGCRATFYVTGKWAEQYSPELNKLYRSGFEIGIHSYDHDDYTAMTAAEVTEDVEKCADIIKRITGADPKTVRVPSGAYNDTAVEAIENGGRQCIQWSIDGLDYTDTTGEEIYGRIVPNTVSGDIILLHGGTDITARILPDIITALRKDYELVNISDLTYKDGFTIDHTGKQIKTNLF